MVGRGGCGMVFGVCVNDLCVFETCEWTCVHVCVCVCVCVCVGVCSVVGVWGRRCVGVPVRELLGEAKVGEADVSVAVQQDVLGLEVAVHDVARVQVLQGAHDLRRV